MTSVKVIDWNQKQVGSAELSDEVFAAKVRQDLLHSVVKWQLACRRSGTHQAKTRAMVSGGGAKPFKQKGTGQARQGSSRSPLLEGGGVIFAPKPRDYSYTLLKKQKRQALCSALSYLKAEGRFLVISEMKSKEGKTKELAQSLKSLNVDKALLIDDKVDPLFQRAASNIPRIRYNSVEGINVYDLLKYNCALITPAALKSLEARCKRESKGGNQEKGKSQMESQEGNQGESRIESKGETS